MATAKAPKKPLSDEDKQRVLEKAVGWAREAERLAHDLLARRRAEASGRLIRSARIRHPAPIDHVADSIATYYFVTATKQMTRWVGVLEQHGDADAGKVVQTFEAALPMFAALRNMREHEDEYMLGEGRQQQAFMARLPAIPPQLGPNVIQAAATARVTIMQQGPDGRFDGKFYLGAHLELGEARDAVAAARAALEGLLASRPPKAAPPAGPAR